MSSLTIFLPITSQATPFSLTLAFRPIPCFIAANRIVTTPGFIPSFSLHLVYILTLYKLVLKFFYGILPSVVNWGDKHSHMSNIIGNNPFRSFLLFCPRRIKWNSAPSFFKQGHYSLFRWNGRYSNSIQKNATDATQLNTHTNLAKQKLFRRKQPRN